MRFVNYSKSFAFKEQHLDEEDEQVKLSIHLLLLVFEP